MYKNRLGQVTVYVVVSIRPVVSKYLLVWSGGIALPHLPSIYAHCNWMSRQLTNLV